MTQTPRISPPTTASAVWINKAVDHYSASQAAHDHLREVYAASRDSHDAPHASTVAALHQQIGYGLKAAQAAAGIAAACAALEAGDRT